MLSLLGGFRAVELASLTIGSVLDGNGQIADRITLAKNQTKGCEARSVPISKRMKKELETYFASLNRLDPQRPLFQSQKRNGGFTTHGITILLKRIFNSAGVTGASSHSGRRTFATRLADMGVSIRVIQRLMGHSSIQTTSCLRGGGRTPASRGSGTALMTAKRLGWLAYFMFFLASHAGIPLLAMVSLGIGIACHWHFWKIALPWGFACFSNRLVVNSRTERPWHHGSRCFRSTGNSTLSMAAACSADTNFSP